MAEQNTLSRDLVTVVQKFFRGVYLNNKKDLMESTVGLPGREALLSTRSRSPEALADLKKEIEEIRLQGDVPISLNGDALPTGQKTVPVGAKSLLLLDFHGQLMVVNFVKEANGWKVDPRFLLASKKAPEPGSPQLLAKQFLYALFAKDSATLKNLVSDSSKIDVLLKNNRYPSGDLDQLLALSAEMPVDLARPGEVLKLPSGEVKKAGESKEEALVLGLYGTVELPFLLKKVDQKWKVVPQPYIEMMQAKGAI